MLVLDTVVMICDFLMTLPMYRCSKLDFFSVIDRNVFEMTEKQRHFGQNV